MNVKFTLFHILVAIAWASVLAFALAGVVSRPHYASDAFVSGIALLSYIFVAYSLIRSISPMKSGRVYWRSFAISSVCYILFLLLFSRVNSIDDVVVYSLFLPFINQAGDFTVPGHPMLNFYLAHLVEYWTIPITGALGGLTAESIAGLPIESKDCDSDLN